MISKVVDATLKGAFDYSEDFLIPSEGMVSITINLGKTTGLHPSKMWFLWLSDKQINDEVHQNTVQNKLNTISEML